MAMHAIEIETHNQIGEHIRTISWRWACSCGRKGRWQTALDVRQAAAATRRARNGGTAHRAAQDRSQA